MHPDVSRRLLLGGALGVGAALGAADFAELAADAAGKGPRGLQGKLPREVDVVVVGAGIAGLVAARDVAKRGRSVLLVESRNRVGGRVLNHELRAGGVIEAGGAFVGPTQDHILRLAKQLKVRTFKEYTAGNSVYISSTTGRQEYQGTIPPDPLILPDAGNLLARIDAFAAEIPVAAPWSHPRAKEWDSFTLGDYVRANAVNASGVLPLLANWTQPGFGADPDELSFLFVLWYVAASGNERTVGTFARNSETVNGAQESRFIGGSGLIPIRLAKQLGDIVALRAPVRAIEHRNNRAIVKTRRGWVRAKRVIVAAPPELVKQIDFAPNLPTKRRRMLNQMEMGQLMKCDAVYETPFWRDAGLNGFGLADAGPVRVAFDNCPANGQPGVLLAFVGGSTWQQIGRLPLKERKRLVLRGFANMFGEQALSPIEYTEQDWTQERWTKGGPTAYHRGNLSMVRYGPAVRRPFRRVHWAGTETSSYWSGYMDGAVRSGKRAAIEVLEKL